MSEARFFELLELYQAGVASDEEWQELAGMINDGRFDQRLRVVIDSVYQAEEGETGMDPARLQSLLQQIYARGANETIFSPMDPASPLQAIPADPVPVISLPRRSRRVRWIGAASIMLVFGAGTWFFYNRSGSKDIARQPETFPRKFDAVPGGQRATLTLSDGTTILLDSVKDGLLARQGGTAVKKLKDGKIVYQAAGDGASKNLFNTMATPRGGQYQLRLPDGTGVWLNASSSITYPAEFTGNKREVTMTGEAYFEVVKDKTKPFIVRTAKEEINVLGTSFNVNSYSDEPDSKTTLLEGAIRINDQLLKPGEAYLIGKAGPGSKANPGGKAGPNGNSYPPGRVVATDVSQDIAWKNGIFDFQDKKLEEVMRQLSRWYDMEIVYEKGIPDIEFGGEMGRDLNLSQVLKGLQSSEVHFSLEGNKKLIVRP